MKKIYLCYSHHDRGIARKLAYSLQRLGFDVWYDEFEIQLGDSIQAKWAEGLNQCDEMIVLLSQFSIDSTWLIDEVNRFYSDKLGKKIIGVLLEDVDIPEELRDKFIVFDFRKTYDSGISSLESHVRKIPIHDDQQPLNTHHPFYPRLSLGPSNIKHIPDFTDTGYLTPSIHLASIKEFLWKFTGGHRKTYRRPIVNIIDFARSRNANYILFGGSFISSRTKPNSIHCVIVFTHAIDIPSRLRKIVIDNTPIEVYYAALDDQDTLNTHLQSLSQNNFGEKIGMIQVGLQFSSEALQIDLEEMEKDQPSKAISEGTITNFEPRGMLVTVHGLLSKAPWNTELSPIASSQGWIFAPYVYNNNWIDLLFFKRKRRHVVDQFREWIFDMQMRYKDVDISIIAHSFGAYIIASYLEGFSKDIPVRFKTIILTGSLINRDYDWHEHYLNSKVIRVRNELATNDRWVPRMPVGLLRLDPLFGRSGVHGFNKETPILKQPISHQIFRHNNVIRRDIVQHYWMPYLNANAKLDWYN